MQLYKFDELKISVIGLGYVGLPLAVEFGKVFPVVGYDIDKDRVNQLRKGIDSTREVSKENLKKLDKLSFSNNLIDIEDSNIYIITVPTPVDRNNVPDLSPLESASALVGGKINKNNIIIYESTVFPGATEDICVPILEDKSGMKYNIDFFCGYSPERINPGDKNHTLTMIKKIVSGSNDGIATFVENLYNKILKAGTYKTDSIKVAEAAKVIENTQRDLNIALINELALIFDKLEIDTVDVLKAAETKWNFLPFRPGLVGGHCIGVDPYYLTFKSQELGYHPEVILSGRRINDSMGDFIADKTITELAKQGINPLNCKIAILGLTFKENCPDIRNTKVLSIIENLRKYNCQISVLDCFADPQEVKSKLGIILSQISNISENDAVILAVGHDLYKNIKINDWAKMLRENGVFIDIKSLYPKKTFLKTKIRHWRL